MISLLQNTALVTLLLQSQRYERVNAT